MFDYCPLDKDLRLKCKKHKKPQQFIIFFLGKKNKELDEER